MEFSFSMDASPRVAIDVNAPLFASVQGVASDLGGGECVFRTRDGQTHVMTHQVLQALDRCRAFLTMAEHVQAVRQVIPSAPAEGVARVLESLVQRRLLISEQDFVAGMQAQAQAGARDDAPLHLLIRAHDGVERSAELQRSLLAASGWRDRVASITWLSIGASDGVRAQHQVQLDGLGANLGGRTRLIDETELRTPLQRIVGHEAGLQGALELLLPSRASATSGQSFNLALTLMAGRRSLILDEHARWPLRRHDEFRREIELRAADRVSSRFYDTSALAMAAGREDEGDDRLAEHDLACGATLGSLFAADRRSHWKSGDFRGAALSEFLTESGATHIAGTISGSRGSLRSQTLEELFLLDAESRASFSSDRDRYLAQLQRCNAWTGTRRAVVTQSCADLPLTLDARNFLPFAMPYGDAPGISFSALLRVTRPQSILLHLPDAIGCVAPAGNDEGIGRQAFTPGLDRFIADYLSTRASDLRAQAMPARIATAAMLLRDLSESAPTALDEFVAEYLQYARSEWVNRLQRVVEEAGPEAPLHWLADLRSIVTANGRALVQASAPSLRPSSLDSGGTALSLAQSLRRIADAMTAWPVLWERLQNESSSSKGWFA